MEKLSPPDDNKPARFAFYGRLATTINCAIDDVSSLTEFAHGLGKRIGSIEKSREREESAKDTINSFLVKFSSIVAVIVASFGTVIWQNIEAKDKAAAAEKQKFIETQKRHSEELDSIRSELELLTITNTRLLRDIEGKDETIRVLEEAMGGGE
jgi:isoleucyl-tRNA synthetase